MSHDVEVHVICAADGGFAMPTAVMAASVAASAAPGRCLALHILDGGLTPALAKRLCRALDVTVSKADARGVALRYVLHAPDTSGVATLRTTPLLSSAAYLRLLAPDLLAQTAPDARWAVYLDGDVLVLRDLLPLLDGGLPLRGPTGHPAPLRAVLDAPPGWSPADPRCSFGQRVTRHAERAGGTVDPKAPYFNSGVLVIDLDRWREEQTTEAILDDLRQNERLYHYADQCGMNAVLAHRWAPLPPEWNVQTVQCKFFGLAPHLRDVAVIHFSGPWKPWSRLYHVRAEGRPRLPLQVNRSLAAYRRAWFSAARGSGWFSASEWARFRATLAVGRARNWLANEGQASTKVARAQLGKIRRWIRHPDRNA